MPISNRAASAVRRWSGKLEVAGARTSVAALRGSAEMCKAFDGSATVLHKGRELAVRLLADGEEAVERVGCSDAAARSSLCDER